VSNTGSWVQDPKTGKLVPKNEYRRKDDGGLYIHGDLESFVSPITNEIISDRRQLREHNREHGVTNSADYSEEFMLKRSQERNNNIVGNTPQARKERIELIKHELDKHGL